MNRRNIILAAILVAVAVIAFAWIDGGRGEPQLITEEIAVPGESS